MAKSDTVTAPAEESVVVVPEGYSVAKAINAATPFEAALDGEVIEGDEVAATIEDNSVPTGLGGLTSEPEFDRDEISLPRLRMAQGLTPEVQAGTARPGQWVLTGSDALDQVTFIPMMMGRDFVHRDEDGVATPCYDARCPKKEWTQDPRTGKRKGPECIKIFRYLGYSIDHGVTLEVHFSKTSEFVGKEINTHIATKGMGKFALVLGSTTRQGPRGPFNVPTIKLATGVPVTEFDAARALVSGS